MLARDLGRADGFSVVGMTVLGRELDSRGHSPMYVPSALLGLRKGA